MSLLSRIGRWVRRDTGAVGSDLADAWEQVGITDSGVAVNSFSAMQHIAVMSCVSILAEDVAKIPLGVYRRTANGGKELAADHYLQRLLRNPNAGQTAFEWKEMMEAALVLRGNAFSVILRDERGMPEQLFPVHPDRCTLYEAPDGDWYWLVTRNGLHEMAVLRDQPAFIHHEDMLHIKWLSTWNSLLGVSRIGLMREAVGLSMSQERHQARFAGQGVRPSGVLETDQVLTPEVSARIAASWQQQYGGWRGAGKTVLLEQGLKWKALGMTMADAQFLESRRYSLEDIARGFRVPLHKLGVPAASGSESTLVQLDQDYLNSVVSSYCERWTARLEKTFEIDGIEYFVDWDYRHFLKADIATRLVALRTGVMGMIYTPNEARNAEGLPPVENGDVLYQPVNIAPIGFKPDGKGGAAGSDQTGVAAEGGDGDPTRPLDDPGAPSNGG